MRKLIILILLLLSACTAAVTYYKPSGSGRLYGHCNTPMHLIKLPVSDGVTLSFMAYPDKGTKVINIYGNIEAASGVEVKLDSPLFILELLPTGEKVSSAVTGFKSNFLVVDGNGKASKIEVKHFQATDSLSGQTHSGSGFWGTMHGDSFQRFEFKLAIKDVDTQLFRLTPPDIIVKGKKLSISPIEFQLTIENIFLSPCP